MRRWGYRIFKNRRGKRGLCLHMNNKEGLGGGGIDSRKTTRDEGQEMPGYITITDLG